MHNCEWTITTPFGKEDLTDYIALHNAKHHNKTTRARISKTDLLKLQKKITPHLDHFFVLIKNFQGGYALFW